MKIKIAKTIFLLICIGVFVFLLLPFLETTPPPAQAQLKAQPQVSTDNPLTAIANRLRHLFGGKGKEVRRLSAAGPQPTNTRPADEFLAAADMPRTSTAHPALMPNDDSTRTVNIPPQEAAFDFGNATLQTDNGEWVLIRQTAPQSGQPGMHEVNVHENPYDRYVKQERARRALPQQPKPEIPDSKWARLIRPVKHFFGLDTPTPVGPSPVTVAHEDSRASLLASAKGNLQTGKYPSIGPARLPWPDITPQQWAQMTPEERQYEQERRSVAQFADLLSGARAAEQAAEIMADTKYPAPKNKQEEQAKEQYKLQMLQQNKEIIKNGILQVMEQNAQDKEPVDELSYMVGCKLSSLPNNTGPCEDPAFEQPTPALPQNVLAEAQAKNAEKFFEITKYALPPGLPVTPVFGSTSQETIDTMLANPAPNIQKTGEVIAFLFDQKQCAQRTCFWVPTDKQKDPQLSDAVKAIGPSSHLKADPAHRYETWKEPFAQYKVSQLPANATEEQKKKAYQEALKQFEENAAPLVPYVEELKEVQDKMLNAINPQNKERNIEDITTFHFSEPTQVPEAATIMNSVILGYEQISLVNAKDSLEASEQMNTSRAHNVNNIKEISSALVTQPATTSAVKAAITQSTQSEAGQQIIDATQNINNMNHKKSQKK